MITASRELAPAGLMIADRLGFTRSQWFSQSRRNTRVSSWSARLGTAAIGCHRRTTNHAVVAGRVSGAVGCLAFLAARLRLGVTGAPLVPRNVPIAEPVDPRQGATHGIDHLDDVAALDMVVEPLRVARADVQAAMAGVGVALSPHRPRR